MCQITDRGPALLENTRLKRERERELRHVIAWCASTLVAPLNLGARRMDESPTLMYVRTHLEHIHPPEISVRQCGRAIIQDKTDEYRVRLIKQLLKVS